MTCVKAPKLKIKDTGAGRPLVMLHGWSCSGVFFAQQMTAMVNEARCIVPDLPGHGETGGACPLTIEAAADDLHRYLIDQDIEDAILCGWSMGALVAFSLIERHGAGRISAVVSIDMSPKVLNSGDWPNGTLNGLNDEGNQHFLNVMIADWPRLPPLIASRLYAADGDTPAELIAFARDEIRKADPVLLQPMWRSLTEQDFRPLLQKFPVPLHLVAGVQSQLYGPGVQAWHAQNVPDFTLHPFANSGHAPHLEEPDAFNKLLSAVLRDTPTAQKG